MYLQGIIILLAFVLLFFFLRIDRFSKINLKRNSELLIGKNGKQYKNIR